MSFPFTPQQEKAIDIAQRHLDACVVAGPGSGKTTVLVEYFRRLVEAGVDPVRILAITFTEKAAGNMRTKLAETFQSDAERRARLERAWVSTVHGFCARLLRENAIFAGVDPEFHVTDERESWRLQQESIGAVLDELFAEDPRAVRALFRGLGGQRLEEAVLNAYDAMRGAGVRVTELALFEPKAPVTMEQVVWAIHGLRQEKPSGWSESQRAAWAAVLESCNRLLEAARDDDPLRKLRAVAAFECDLGKLKKGPIRAAVKHLRDELLHGVEYLLVHQFYSGERALLLEVMARFDRAYRQRKRQAGVLDFADLEECTVRLLEENPDTSARLRDQFDHILMDEYQDTNGQQATLLELIRTPDRFYAVGDVNQSIFGFRHAVPEEFKRLRAQVEESGRRMVELTDNFRSRAHILSAVETLLDGAPGIEPRALVAGRTFPDDKQYAVELISVTAEDADGALDLEAGWVAQRILELTGSPAHRYQDVAVLVRNTEVVPAFTRAFELAGIPHVVNRGRGFYGSREVNDLTHLLRVLVNPRDEISLAAVLRSPLVELSDEALLGLRFVGMPRENLGSVVGRLEPSWEADFAAGDWRKLTRFRELLHGWRLRRELHSFDRLLLSAIDECGYRFESGDRGAANVEKFLAQAREASGRMSLDAFVEELALLRAENPREPDAPPEDSSNTVKIMTVHSAKGLEYPVVFVAAMQKGIATDLAVVEFSRHHGLGASWTNPATGESKVDLTQHAIREERKLREEEEASRLLYVAMTRAENHLVLSCSGNGKKPQNWALAAATKLGVDLETPFDQVVTRTAPDGKEWRLRLFCTREAAPAARRTMVSNPAEEAAVEFVNPPLVTGQHDTNITVTDLTLFSGCPRRYYLSRYLGWEGRARTLEDGGEERKLAASEFGSQVHAILAGVPPAEPDAAALELASAFGRSPLGRRMARATRLEREFDFLMAVGESVVRGQIDLWFEEAGEAVLVDYKTDAVTAHEAHDRARGYEVQLRFYAMAVERMTGRPPERAYLYFLKPDVAVEVSLAPSLLEPPELVVEDLLAAQDRLEFPLREGAHCRRCAFYRDLCPAGT